MEHSIIKEKALALGEKMVEWRRDFHQNPEIGLDCYRTSAIVADNLKSLNYNVKEGYAKTGIVATLGEGSPVIAMRVDMDALPIHEETGLPFASKTENVMHACGHDGHTAIGLGVAHAMAELLPKLKGKLVLIFQPGEEYPGGAPIMLKEGALEKDRPDVILGMHIFPELPSGTVGLRYGVMTASNIEFSIAIKGEGGHGAYPHRSIDPFPALAALINGIQTIISRSIPPLEPQVISLGEVKGGAGFNVVPGAISLKGTIRSLSDTVEKTALRRLKEIADGIETAFNVSIVTEAVQVEPTMICDEKVTEMAENVLIDYLGKAAVVRIDQPSLGVDDFSYYTKIIPATYMRLGSRDEEKGYVYPLHNNKFDFDEQLLSRGLEAALIVLGRAFLVNQ